MNTLILKIYAAEFNLATAISTQRAKKMRFYAGVFTIFFGIMFWIETSPLHASEQQNIRLALNEFYITEESRTLSFSVEMADMAKVNMHKRKGAEAFCEAEDLCMFLPEDKRDIAYQLFQSCVEATASAAIGGWSGLIADLIVQLTRYGIFCCKQADKIRDKLKESEYHYYMATYRYNK